MRRNVIPMSAQQLRSEQRGSYRTPRPAGNPLMVFLLPFLPNLLPPSWLKGRELWGCAPRCCNCAFSSRVSLHSGSSGGALAPETEGCPAASQQSTQHWVMADSCRTPLTLKQCCAKASQGRLESSRTGAASSSAIHLCCSSALACTAHRFLVCWYGMNVTAKRPLRCPLRRNFGNQVIIFRAPNNL